MPVRVHLVPIMLLSLTALGTVHGGGAIASETFQGAVISTKNLLSSGTGVSSAKDYTFFSPPGGPPPANRQGGGTRGPFLVQGEPLTALVPETGYGLTTAAYPTLFFYIPRHSQPLSGAMAEFILLDETNKVVYETMFPMPNSSGIVPVSLPETVNPLEIGKRYNWFFSLVYDPVNRDSDVFVEGWVERMEPDPGLTRQLQQTADSDRPLAYAEAGIWYDALATLATLRSLEPDNSTFVTQWVELLNAVDLQTLAQQPLLEVQGEEPSGTDPSSDPAPESPLMAPSAP